MDNRQSKTKHFFRSAAGILCLAALLVLCCFAALRFGSSPMTNDQFLGAITKRDGFETQTLILLSVRLPRILAGILAGAGLSVSGVLLQSITDNSLASPNIIGVNSGAGFAVALLLTFFPTASGALAPIAFVGAFLATMLIIAISSGFSGSKSSLILAGIALTALLNAGISFLNLLDTDVLSSYNAFSIGSLAGVSPESLVTPAFIIVICCVISLVFSKKINALCIGESACASLGINVKLIRIIAMVCASACAASVVSFAGLLGFVGLVVPHIARRIVGNDTKSLIITGTLSGAALVVTADLAGRMLAKPSEIPVGITMALIGAPFFMVLLMRRKHRI